MSKNKRNRNKFDIALDKLPVSGAMMFKQEDYSTKVFTERGDGIEGQAVSSLYLTAEVMKNVLKNRTNKKVIIDAMNGKKPHLDVIYKSKMMLTDGNQKYMIQSILFYTGKNKNIPGDSIFVVGHGIWSEDKFEWSEEEVELEIRRFLS